MLTALLVAGCGAGPDPVVTPVPGPAGTDGASDAGWRELPGSPLSPRSGSVLVGVGDTAYVIGGWTHLCPPTADCVVPTDSGLVDGAAVDLRTGEWRGIEDAPLPLHHTPAVSVGALVYVVTTCRSGPTCTDPPELLRYDTVADRWDEVGPLPGGAPVGSLVAWEGDLVVVSGSDERGRHPDLLHDTERGTWTRLPDDPLPRVFDRVAVADDDRLVLFGSPLAASAEGSGPKAVAVYRRQTEEWTRWPDAPGGGYQAWRAGERIVLNPHFSRDGGGVLDLATARWSVLPPGPADDSWEGDLAGVLGDGTAEFEYGAGWVLDLRGTSPRWIEVPDVVRSTDGEAVAAVGSRLVVSGGQRWETRAQGELLGSVWSWAPPEQQ